MNALDSGLMMDFPLTTQHLVWRMTNVHPRARILSILDNQGAVGERDLAQVAERSRRLAASLHRIGVAAGDRVGSFAYNSAEHMETYLGVMSMGAVLHTINLRLHASQIVWMVNHAADKVIILDDILADQFLPLLDQMPTVEAVVIIGEGATPDLGVPAYRFEELALADAAGYTFPSLDERAAAALCYTSGTTGDPKGVLYSHRSITLHALIMSGSEVFGIAKHDVVLATVPMFHVMGWGLPLLSVIVGADVVMPGRHLDPASVSRAIRDHGVTWSSGVPTIWMDLLRLVDEGGVDRADLTSLKRLILGGSQVPTDLVRRFAALGVEVLSGWGMTEIFPGAAVATTDPRVTTEENLRRQVLAGRISPFYEIRLIDEQGRVAAHDGTSRGEIEVRGPVVASQYFRLGDEAEDRFNDGWLKTGDIGTVDPEGWVTLVDRAKDIIKSGGEWISSADLEVALLEHPAVLEAAVIARPDVRWGERPHAVIVASAPLTLAELREHLEPRVPRWWIPETFEEVTAIPRTTTGKFDKKVLRASLETQEEMEAHEPVRL